MREPGKVNVKQLESYGVASPVPKVEQRGMDDLSELMFALMLERRGSGTSIKKLLEDLERRIIMKVLRECGGNQAQTARFLNIKTTTLCEKIKKYGILTEIRRSIAPRDLFLNRLLLHAQTANERRFHRAEVP